MRFCCPLFCRLVLLLSAVATAAAAAQPNEGKPDGIRKRPTVTVKQIDAMIAAARQSPGLKDKPELLKQVLALFEQAKTHLEGAAGFRKRLAGYQTLQKDVKRLVSEQKTKLERPQQDPSPEPDARLADLKQQLATAQQTLKTAQQALASAEAERKNRSKRRTTVPLRITAVTKELAAKPKPPKSAELKQAEDTRHRAKQLELQAEIAALEAEIPTYDITTSLLDLQIQVAARRVQWADRAVKKLEKFVARRRGNEADQQLRAARDLLERLRANKLPKPLIKLAEENVAFARRRTGEDGLGPRIDSATEALHKAEETLKATQADRKSVDEKLKIPGIEDVIGQVLLQKRRGLPDTGALERAIRKRRREMADARFELIRIQEQSQPLDKLDEQIDQTTETLGRSPDTVGRESLTRWVRAVLTMRHQLLKSLRGDYNSLLKQLAELSATEHRLVDTVEDFKRVIDRHILWIRSTPQLEWADFATAGEGLSWAFSESNWRGVWESFRTALASQPVLSGFALVVLVLMLWRENAMKRRLQEVGEQAALGFTQPYHLTAQAMGLTLLLAAQWAAAFWFVGWRLSVHSTAHRSRLRWAPRCRSSPWCCSRWSSCAGCSDRMEWPRHISDGAISGCSRSAGTCAGSRRLFCRWCSSTC